jgi:putative SOS response-associated peptidase YedK
MCGRFTLQSPTDALFELFGVSVEEELRPRFNVAPTQSVWAWRAPEGEGELVALRWGLIPFFAKDAKIGARMINARSETVSSKPSFRAAFKRRRCLIAADGFIEWKKMGDGSKQPFHIRRRDRRPFAFAGLWERWTSPEAEVIESATILTTEPNDLVAEIHDRMPVILEREDFGLWLDPQIQSRESLEVLFEPCPAGQLDARAVSRRVSNARNDDPACLEEIPEP